MKKSIKKPTPTPATPTPVVRGRGGDSFQNFEARLGYGTGNQSDGAGYAINYTSRIRFELEAMYRSSWICGKAVDVVAEDMTKRGIELNSTIDPGESDELMRTWKELRIWDALCDTIKWARLYGGAIAVLLIDGQNLSTPLRIETVGKDKFKGLLVLDRWQVTPTLQQLVTEMGPDMGLPMYYDVIGDSMGLKRAHIHYSRVIRIVGQDLPYWQRITEMLWGQSVIERLFDRLLAFDSTTQGAAQLVYKAHLRTYKVEGLRDIIAMGGPALEGLTAQINFIRRTQTNEGMTLMDSKDEFEAHSYAFGGLDTVLLQFSQQLSGALGIPLTKLFGQSPAGLNSTGESDVRNYYDSTNQEQERRLRVGIGVLLQVTHLSKFGKALTVGSDFTFRPLWQLTDLEKATMAATITTAVTSAVSGGVVGRQTGMKELRQSSHLTGVWTNISDESIAAASDDVDLGEMSGAASDPFGGGADNEDDPEDGPAKKKTADEDFNEADHPRKDDGEFTAGGGAAGARALDPDIAPLFQHSNEALRGKPQEALAWVRGGRNRFVEGAIVHPAFDNGIGLLHGEPGDPNKKWRGGFGVSHIDGKRPGYLDEAIKVIPSLSLVESESNPERKVLSDGQHPERRAIVSLNLRGHETPAWLLTSYFDERSKA
jgi:hypothetical protein